MADSVSPLRVIMVDDDPDDILLTQTLLRRSSVPVDLTGLNSGRDLLAYMKNNGTGSIDVILLDKIMPVETGFDVLKKLKDDHQYHDTNILMFSTHVDQGDKQLALELGADDMVKKPAQLAESKMLIDLLDSYRSR